MKPLETCLSEQQLAALLCSEVRPSELALIEEHLCHCYKCSLRAQTLVGDDAWWSCVRTSLSEQHSDINNESQPEAETGVLFKQLQQMLGPTDDPAMMGRIGGYEVVGLLGRGGMGAVFKAFDRSLNRYFAIKLLLPHVSSSGAARTRFAREARAAAAVVDDHVMPIVTVDSWQGVPYIVMPYYRGSSLHKRLSDCGALEIREILRVALQSAIALSVAHDQGIIHRDVKPGNIFLDTGIDRARLMDFGLVRAIDDATLTGTGTLAGTPQFMSPEQVRCETLDPRSDLFSLGAVMYAMCTGRAPFRAETSYAVLRLITDCEPRSIREVNPEVPVWLEAIVLQLMAKSPQDRFQSAREVADLLEGCLAHVQRPTVNPLPENVAASVLLSNRRAQMSRVSWRDLRRPMVMTAAFRSFLVSLWRYNPMRLLTTCAILSIVPMFA